MLGKIEATIEVMGVQLPLKPIFVILGGPNGAGKTTGALSILPPE